MSLRRRYRHFAEEGADGPFEVVLSILLAPLGWLYGLISRVRAKLYRSGCLKSYRATVSVISVGNLSVGGTGKTPVVDWLLHYLCEHGERPAVISRGYGGRLKEGVGVVARGDGSAPLLAATLCGDEPLLLAQHNPQVTVLVAPKRRDGVQLAVEEFKATIIVLDDGFQHLAVARDLDIVLLDARRPLGNGAVLPAGLLREAPAALARGDLFLLTRAKSLASDGTDFTPPGPTLRCHHRLSPILRTLDHRSVACAELLGKKGVAFAGIAGPEAFFTSLREIGLNLSTTIALDDHVVFDSALIERLNRQAADADFFVTTEKDGVKLRALYFTRPCYQAVLDLAFEPVGQLEAIIDRLLQKGGSGMTLSPQLLEILACPKCKGPVVPVAETLVCQSCKLAYPVRDNIPVMLIDEAKPVA